MLDRWKPLKLTTNSAAMFVPGSVPKIEEGGRVMGPGFGQQLQSEARAVVAAAAVVSVMAARAAAAPAAALAATPAPAAAAAGAPAVAVAAVAAVAAAGPRRAAVEAGRRGAGPVVGDRALPGAGRSVEKADGNVRLFQKEFDE